MTTTQGGLTSKQARNFGDLPHDGDLQPLGYLPFNELSGRFSHKLRNSLAVISSAACQISESDQVAMGTDDRELLGAVITASDQLNETITQFMQLVDPHKISPERIDINELCRIGVSLALEPFDFPESSCSLRFDEPRLELDADPNQIRSMLHNLMTNALQSMSITDHLQITTKRENKRVVITIENSGRGIESKILPSVFLPFFSTQPGKLGLGLPIAARIASDHGGSITVENGFVPKTDEVTKDGQPVNVKFTVTLPVPVRGGRL